MEKLVPLKEVPLLILAGGRATRLGNLSKELPKYLMPINQGLSFADWHLDWVRRQGFKKVLLSIGYLGEKIKEHCESGKKWDLEIDYIEDGAEPLGTGGAVKKSLGHFDKYLALTYGDTGLSLNPSEVFEDFQSKNWAEALMTYFRLTVSGHKPNVQEGSSGRLLYSKTSPQVEWPFIDYGFLFFRESFVRGLPEGAFDLAQALEESSKKQQLAGFEIQERFWEIGSPEALEAFRQKLKKNPYFA